MTWRIHNLRKPYFKVYLQTWTFPLHQFFKTWCVCVCGCVSELDTPKTGRSEKKQKPSETCGFLGFKLWPYPSSCLQLEFSSLVSRHKSALEQRRSWWRDDHLMIHESLSASQIETIITLKTNKKKHQPPPSSENLKKSGPSPFDPVGYSSDEASRTSLRLSRKCWDSTTESQ